MIAAIVPAAGQSRRMGRPKLTLPTADGGTVIDRVVSALRRGGADHVVVVCPPRDEPGALGLVQCVTTAGAIALTCSSPTPDMRATVEVGIDHLERAGMDLDGVLLAPGDSVGLSPSLVSAVVRRFRDDPGSIVVPIHDGRRGHPMAIPWDLARSIRSLPEGQGINALRTHHADRVSYLEVAEPGSIDDLDTPDDYERWAPRPR